MQLRQKRSIWSIFFASMLNSRKRVTWSELPVSPALTFSGMGGKVGAAATEGLMTYAFTHGEFSSSPSVHPPWPESRQRGPNPGPRGPI